MTKKWCIPINFWNLIIFYKLMFFFFFIRSVTITTFAVVTFTSIFTASTNTTCTVTPLPLLAPPLLTRSLPSRSSPLSFTIIYKPIQLMDVCTSSLLVYYNLYCLQIKKNMQKANFLSTSFCADKKTYIPFFKKKKLFIGKKVGFRTLGKYWLAYDWLLSLKFKVSFVFLQKCFLSTFPFYRVDVSQVYVFFRKHEKRQNTFNHFQNKQYLNLFGV